MPPAVAIASELEGPGCGGGVAERFTAELEVAGTEVDDDEADFVSTPLRRFAALPDVSMSVGSASGCTTELGPAELALVGADSGMVKEVVGDGDDGEAVEPSMTEAAAAFDFDLSYAALLALLLASFTACRPATHSSASSSVSKPMSYRLRRPVQVIAGF